MRTDSHQLTLTGRRAVVTGAASGIGEAIALHLSGLGAHVVVCDIDGAGAKRIARDIGGEAWTIDLSDTEGLAGLTLETDILVNNAGVQHVAAVEEFPPDRFAFIVRLMLEAPFLLCRAALPHMYANGWGRMIHISSAHGLRASPFKVAYVAAKHGLEGMSKVVALESAEHGVTSNCINPGYVHTPLIEKQIHDQARVHNLSESDVLNQVMLKNSAIKRLIEPHEVGSAAAYLCSDDAAYMTGANLVLDGGWSAR